MSEPIHVILCAGSGTRLFPMSNKKVPKQFLKLENKYSLVQNTVLRMSQYPELVITTMAKYVEILTEQLNELGLKTKYTIVVVPESYNTAYSICAVSLLFENRKIIAIPSDKIFNQDEFAKLMETANNTLQKNLDKVLFFGIKPTYPATGFGYLEQKGDLVVRFVEKPTVEKAKEYIESGKYFWNGGMIGFVSEVLNDKYRVHRPDILKICKHAVENSLTLGGSKFKLIYVDHEKPCGDVEDISIDYAINEKLREGEMSLVTFSGKWADVGSWNSVHDVLEKDEKKINKSAVVKNYNSGNCLIMTKKPVYLNGVSDLILVETDDCILVSHMDKSQDIKKLLAL
jgi:mannose-1-phosphate guanylyltransferase / mannose-6-phosphate isomerase